MRVDALSQAEFEIDLARSASASAVATQLLAYGFACAHPSGYEPAPFLRRTLLADITSDRAASVGFRTGKGGTHSSRTIMLNEISQLFSAAPDEATPPVYANAVLQQPRK